MALLDVRELAVRVDGKNIIENVSLRINKGEITVLMGPNASGKSTLLYSIMGLQKYRVVKGKILFNGKDITNEPSWKRARMGIGLAFQNPPKILIRLRYLSRKIAELHGFHESLENISKLLSMEQLLNRNIHYGFSGGESKRTELFLLMLQKPKLALLDEPDSGVDIESIRSIADCINRLAENGAGVLLVTHQGYILRYIDNLGRGYVMYNGRIIYEDDAYIVLKKIMIQGYSGLASSHKKA